MLRSANVTGWIVFLSLTLTPGCSDAEGSAPDAPPLSPPPTVDEDPRLEAVELSTTRVHVEELGNPAGDVIIVLHGGPGDDYRYMLPLAERAAGVSLVDEHLLVYWDQRGTGQSRRHDSDELSLEAYARDLADLIDHYSPDAPVALLGHSWGGTYAALFMNEHPERVRAAALLEPGGLSSELRVDDAAEEQKALLDTIVGPFLGDGRGLDAQAHARADQALVDVLLAMNPDSDVPFSRMGSLALRELEFGELQRPFDFTTRLERVGLEVLFIAGGDSDTLGAAQQDRQRARFPSSRLEVIAAADHNSLTLGRAEAVIPLLVEYFTPVR